VPIEIAQFRMGISLINRVLIPKEIVQGGGLQYCSNNATTPGASFSNFINPVVRNKLGSDGAVCTSTSSCRSCHLVSWHKSARAQANFYMFSEEAF